MPSVITVNELEKMRSSSVQHALLDVREKGEFVQKHIYRAVPVPRGLIEIVVPARVPAKDVEMVVYCDDGHRSGLAALTLEEMGYSDVRTLRGGLEAWEQAGFRVDYGTNVPGKDYGEQVAVEKSIPSLTPDEVVQRQQNGEHVIVLDSRTKEEFEISHVPGAYSVPGGELPNRIQTVNSDPTNADATIVVNCAGRTRSILGADVLIRMGIRNVYALENGTMAWQMAGHELESGHGLEIPGFVSDELASEYVDFANRIAVEDGAAPMELDEFDRLRNSGEIHYVIDARLPDEFEAGHVPNSVSMPAGQTALAADEVIVVNQAPIAFISNHGIRARIAASMARQLEYDRVYFLDGGISSWIQAGHKLEIRSPKPEIPGLNSARQRVPSISVDDLANALSRGERPVLIDVRGSGDYALSHISGSTWVPRGDLERRILETDLAAGDTVVVVCNDGVRSSLAAATLKDMDFPEVRWLAGGLDQWGAAGYATVEGLDGANVSLREAKDDIHMTGRRGPLARTREDMIAYLEWEVALGEKYERRD